MKLRDWLKTDKEEQASEPVEVGGLELDGDGEVLESGFDLEDFQEDIEGREDAIQQLEREVDRHQKKKKRAVEKAQEADSQSDRKAYMVEAKEHKVAGGKKEKILDHLRSEKLTLKQLRLQHLQNNIGASVDTELDIDISDLDASQIQDAVEEGSDELWEASENMEEIDEAMDMADSETAALDLSSIQEELVEDSNEDHSVDLEDRSLETEEEIDQAIDETIERMDENL